MGELVPARRRHGGGTQYSKEALAKSLCYVAACLMFSSQTCWCFIANLYYIVVSAEESGSLLVETSPSLLNSTSLHPRILTRLSYRRLLSDRTSFERIVDLEFLTMLGVEENVV